MRALITIQDADVTPANLGAFFGSQGVELVMARLDKGEALPEGDFDCLVTMGGRMNPGEEADNPWMAPLTASLREWAQAGRPFMGICLGAQLLASALGAKTGPAMVPEIGWRKIELTPAAQNDPVMAGLPESFSVVEVHRYTFEIPRCATQLATARDCPNQVFAYNRAYAFQPHIEATVELIKSWYEINEACRDIVPGFETDGPAMKANSEKIFLNFLNMARAA